MRKSLVVVAPLFLALAAGCTYRDVEVDGDLAGDRVVPAVHDHHHGGVRVEVDD